MSGVILSRTRGVTLRWCSLISQRWRNVHVYLPAAGLQETKTINDEEKLKHDETFAEIFKHSKFVSVVNPVGQRVEGKVLATVEDKMYIDFGCKFHAVVKVPDEDRGSYRKGSRVVVRVLDLEMTDHFIGDSRDLTLLEAEVELLGLAKS